MATALTGERQHETADRVFRVPKRRLFALPEARWAAASLIAFLLGLGVQLGGGPSWLYWTLYLVCYVTGGWEPALSGLRALRERTLDVDLLMIVAALGAAAIGQVMDGGLLIVIFATSGALEAFATARTEDSVRGLLDLAPATAVRIAADGTEQRVDAAILAPGDEILVRPGERVGADGVVHDGTSEIDQATITGEPLPMAKQVGDEVFAGTLNGTGALRVRVTKHAHDSVIARIVALVSEASETKAPTQLFIERIEQRYSVGVVVATLAVFALPLLFGDSLEGALTRAMTFMIVASPCAVVLATMPPLLSAVANAGRHGVLVKSAVALQRLGEAEHVALDKTGTLTEGTPVVASIAQRADATVPAETALAHAAAVEHLSEHPIARAITSAAAERGLVVPDARDFAAVPGVGVAATVEGRRVEVGRPHERMDAPDTTVVITIDGIPTATVRISDRLRPDAAMAVRQLRAVTGTEPTLLTGDNERAAHAVAEATGITDVHTGLLPQEKVDAVRASGHRTVLVGDGINDAPAMAAAHCGVAVGRTGADLTLETADAVVVRDELAAIPRVITLARRARRLVRQNLVIAGSCIVVLVLWDLIGTLPLPLGVAGHEGSTVLVALNGLRLLRDKAWTG